VEFAAIQALLPSVFGLIEKLIPDPVAAETAKMQMQQVLNQGAAQILSSDDAATKDQDDVVKTWINSTSWAQQNWLPLFMFMFMFIIADNWLIIPLLHGIWPSLNPIPMPEQMWSLIEIALGVHVGAKGLDTVGKAFDQKKFIASLQNKVGKLTQKQLDAVLQAEKDAQS
jgi:hypothetical protein